MVVLVNGQVQELEAGVTVAAMVALLQGDADAKGIAVAVDGEVVPRGAWERTELADGSRVEVVAAVQGG